MKKISFSALLVASFCFFQSCNSNTSSTNSADSTRTADSMKTANNNTMDTSNKMNQNNTAQNTTPLPKDAQDFVMKAASGGMMEVQAGQIASQKAQSDRVKNFGQMMVTDHSKANDELKSLVSSRNVTVPSALAGDEQKEIDMLNNKTGKDFDKAYMDMMLKDHEKDVAEFKKASSNLSDSSIKGFAARTLPVLQTHLDSARAIDKSHL